MKDRIVNLLNDLLEQDPHGIACFISVHFPCNNTLANHPMMQVKGYGPTAPSFGVLGFLNGLFSIESQADGYIVANYGGPENNRRLTHFSIEKF